MSIKKAGLTLSELVVTMVIVGVLAAIMLPKMGTMVKKMKSKEGINVLMAVYKAQKDYALDHDGAYADSIAKLDITVPAMKNFYDLRIEAGSDVWFMGDGPFTLLGWMRFTNNEFLIYVLDDGRIICEKAGNPLCQKMGFEYHYS